MTRPLKYDEQFNSLINSGIKENFLWLFSIKIQSTAFYQTLSLQNSIRVCAVYDLLFGLTILFLTGINFSFIELALIILCIIFFLLALNTSINFRLRNAGYYYYWRLFITFFIPLRELYNYYSSKNCFYVNICTTFKFYLCCTIGLTIIHLYFARIAWSFYLRLRMGQELLVIHGKNLEKMFILETSKNAKETYKPPNINQQHEMQYVNVNQWTARTDNEA